MTEGKVHRLRRGASSEHVYTPTNLHFGHIDSAFQSQEYIAQLIRQDPHDVQKIVTPPKADDEKSSVDDGCWLYEQLRRLAQDLTYPLITNLQLECNRDSCPEMKAGEWLYLCVAHGNATGGHIQCCAIDYIVHTLDSATALLNSTRVFPSRLSVPQSSYRHFSSLARRLSRIFAHAYYHHRELFSQAEAESSLYARFLALSQQHSLVPAELLLNSSNDRSHHAADEHRDPGSPQSAIEPGQEGTNMARRLFEEWTGNGGAEESDEVEPEEEHLDDEDPVDEPPADREPNVPVADQHTDVPKIHPEPEEPPSGTPSGDSHGSHDEVLELPTPVISDSNKEAETASKVDDEKVESKGAENEKVEEKVEPSSITDATPDEAARAQSPVKEPEAKESEKPKETKSEVESEKPKDDGEQSKDKDTTEH
ncbi:Mob1/phocein [Rhizoctonia solani]|nr:Mob1/phocein [Rhizoctonia solani]